jgi:hypothetical protein
MLVDDLLEPPACAARSSASSRSGGALPRLRGWSDAPERATRRGLLDEVFLTTTPFAIDTAAHDDVIRIFDFEAAGATLVAEGRAAADESWLFRRWRFSPR